uniref:PD-(D/E)XK endonuclease-like domain-containing protein n=1 Tax=Mycena chlorophos TaxID=658473 RepID=A0ABQ0KVQ7_MYCCL|nr:predicted protein [Mycena chlorophos]
MHGQRIFWGVSAMFDLEHSPLGGSSAYRFLACAFSFLEHRRQLMAETFVEIPSEYAALGTGAHELGATCLIEQTEPFEYFGKAFNGFRAGYDGEINLDAVSIYVNTCRMIIDTYGPGEVVVERTYHAKEVHPLLKGTVDFGFLTSTALHIVDYKNGEGVGVDVVDSDQLLYYAFIMILMTPGMKIREKTFPIHLTIVQPNFFGIFEDPITWTTTLGDVLTWGWNTLLPRMNHLMKRTDAPTAEDANPGDHCQFCPVMLHCPRLKQAFLNFARADEDFITMLPDYELDALYAERVYARRFMNELDKVVYARKVTGGNIPSAKLVDKKVTRVWKPGAPIRETFGADAVEPQKLKSPAGIEKLSSRGKEFAKEWGYKPETGALTIAPLSDPRPEAKPRTNDKVFEKFAQDYADAGF